MSRRALLPDNEKENPAKETPQRTSDKNKPKKVSTAMKTETSEIPRGKGVAVKLKQSPKIKSTDKGPQEKNIDPVMNISNTRASSLVNGEANME